jgi:hypothetical protein
VEHADAIAKLEARLEETKAQNAALAAAHAALAAAHTSTVSQLEKDKAALEAQVHALQAHATSKLTDIHTAVAALHTLLPPAVPPASSPSSVPSLATMAFDRDWCVAACGTTAWKVDVGAVTSIMRVHVTQKAADAGILTLRSASPLPRRPALPVVDNGCQPDHHQLLPAYRVVVESYSDAYQWCSLGFVPSHNVHAGGAAVTPVVGRSIFEYGGWYITVYSAQTGGVSEGWAVLKPSDGAYRYATTAQVPAVPAGGAVEFAVDYAAGICRVAFYTPAAVVSGFVDAPYAKMELRFVATDRPARPIPTIADSGVDLYPAASTCAAGAVWRFASSQAREASRSQSRVDQVQQSAAAGEQRDEPLTKPVN